MMNGVDIINCLLLVFAAGPIADPLFGPTRKVLKKNSVFVRKNLEKKIKVTRGGRAKSTNNPIKIHWHKKVLVFSQCIRWLE